MRLMEDECRAAGIDPKAVAAIARRLERAAKDASRLGLRVFGGSGGGDLRTNSQSVHERPLILAQMNGSWDGGDGSASDDEEGLLRGEGV